MVRMIVSPTGTGEEMQQGRNCDPTVANVVLFADVHLCKGPFMTRGNENGIISKASFTFGGFTYPSCNEALEDVLLPPIHERKYGAESGTPFVDIGHPCKKEFDIGPVVALRPGESCGENTRCAVKRIHFQSGVVR